MAQIDDCSIAEYTFVSRLYIPLDRLVQSEYCSTRLYYTPGAKPSGSGPRARRARRNPHTPASRYSPYQQREPIFQKRAAAAITVTAAAPARHAHHAARTSRLRLLGAARCLYTQTPARALPKLESS